MPATLEARTQQAAQTAEPVAALDRVTKTYGSVTALDDLSLELRRGEIVALLGPNGAGKTTAVRLLLGLSTPTSGTSRIFGGDPRDAATRTRIGAMLQVASIPRTLKVKEHIDLFRSYFPNPLPFAEIVRIAQLEGIEDRLFEKLSGGQKQRLLFGLALCGNPEIVFLDEPTVGMDIEARRGLWTQIRALAAQGKTVLLTTHYLEEADALAHRIIVINKGKVVSEGTPQQVKGSFASRKIKCITTLSTAQIWAMPGVVDVEQTGSHTFITAGNAESVLRRMLACDEDLSDLEVVAPGLEDAFLALTQR
jgi:ABC-2 type transport system ATP-binding protein